MSKLIECPKCLNAVSSLTTMCVCGFNFSESALDRAVLDTCIICHKLADIPVRIGKENHFMCESHYREKFAPVKNDHPEWKLEDFIHETKRLVSDGKLLSKN